MLSSQLVRQSSQEIRIFGLFDEVTETEYFVLEKGLTCLHAWHLTAESATGYANCDRQPPACST